MSGSGISTAGNFPKYVGTDGMTVTDSGWDNNDFCLTGDSRLSDARFPTVDAGLSLPYGR